MTTAPRGELLHRVREEEGTVTHQRLVGYHDNDTMRRASNHIKGEEEMERYRVTGRTSLHNGNRKWKYIKC